MTTNRTDLPILGRTCVRVTLAEDKILFELDDGTVWSMFHDQNCCEDVRIEDICGDLDDLVGVPLTLAEVSTTHVDSTDWQADWDSVTWTFYRFAAKGYVTIRWRGESNGYYSEEVAFEQVAAPDK